VALESLFAKVAHGGKRCSGVESSVGVQLRQYSACAGGCAVRMRGTGGKVSAVIARVGQSSIDICEIYTT